MINFVKEDKKVTDVFLINLPVGSTFLANVFGYEHLVIATPTTFVSLTNLECSWNRYNFNAEWFTKLVDIEVKIND